jgi:hypothetical protein
VAVLVVIVAFVALAAFALLARTYQPGRPAVRVPNGSLGLTYPKLATPIAASSPIPTAVLGTTQTPAAPPTKEVAPKTPTTPAPGSDTVALAPCELGLAVPTEQAGLANLVPLVPLFGPFSPEAFAMVPAFAPGFPLFGPLIVAGGEQLAANQASVDALYSVAHPLEVAGFDAISPLYAPIRPQVLAGEEQFATTLAPMVETFAGLPGATCLPAALALFF